MDVVGSVVTEVVAAVVAVDLVTVVVAVVAVADSVTEVDVVCSSPPGTCAVHTPLLPARARQNLF